MQTNQPMFGLSVFLNEANAIPVEMINVSGGAITGLVASGVIILTSLNGAAYAALTPLSGTWIELGYGIYELTVPAANVNAEGVLAVRVETVPTGVNPSWNLFAKVNHRVDQWVAWASVEYNETTGVFQAVVGLSQNGQAVTNPTSCTLILRDEAGATTPVNVSSSSPNAEGVFYVTVPSVNLNANDVYELYVQVYYSGAPGGVVKSTEGAITFN